jgi:SAM-dependent methyltransferase
MRETLLPLLCCPECEGDLSLEAGERDGDHIMSGTLSSGCGAQFPITSGVPRFVPSEMPAKQRETVEAFAWEWNHFDEVVEEHREQFLDWIAPVPPEYFRDKVVLDAGCGKGRHLYWAAQFGVSQAVGVDLGTSVNAAFRNTRHLRNAHVVQADLYQLPLRRSTFDYVYCIGVLHHLRDPRLGFKTLVRHLKPDAGISAWVYGREGNGWIVKLLNPLRERVTSRMPRGLLNLVSFCLAVPLVATVRGFYGPINRHERLKPVRRIAFYNDYLYWLSKWRFREVHSIIFDQLVAPIAFYIRRQEFESWFTEAELRQALTSCRNGNSWRGFSSRPGTGTDASRPATVGNRVAEPELLSRTAGTAK